MKTIKPFSSCKMLLLVLLFSAIAFVADKSPAFKEIHSTKLPFKPGVVEYAHTGDFKFFLSSNKTDMLMFDGLSGKILWNINFKKEFANEKFSNQFWNKEANVILVFDEDSKKELAEKYFIDGKTGKLLWKSNKYVSDFGQYELSEGFQRFYDVETNGVLLPTKESVDFVDAYTGKAIWTKNYELSGKAKQFDCFLMKYYNLVMITMGKEEEMYLTTRDGKEVTDIEPYFNKKKYLADRKHATIINIPGKNMYVIMQGKTSQTWKTIAAVQGMSANIPKYKMTFTAYEEGTNKELWRNQHTITFVFDAIDNSPYVRLTYADGKLFVQHDPMLKMNDGLTVFDINTGEKLWEASYSSSEMKSGLSRTILTPFPAPEPVVADGYAYVVDKLRNTVRCYDAQNGKLTWESKKYPVAQKIPTLIVANGAVIMAHGSPATKIVQEEQSFGTSKRTVWKRQFLDKDKYGLIAYDAKTGNILWEGDQIGKKAKDNFSYIAGVEYVDGKLYCATDENFFILDPLTGDVVQSVPVSKEKLGKAWKMIYFADRKKLIVNCEDGIIKINALTATKEGSLKIPNVSAFPAQLEMNADDDYLDYAIFTNGNSEKMEYKTFASIDLENMRVRGSDDAGLLFSDNPHFSDGAGMFFKADGEKVTFYRIQ